MTPETVSWMEAVFYVKLILEVRAGFVALVSDRIYARKLD